MSDQLDFPPARVVPRRRAFAITPIEAAVLAVRWVTVGIIVAVWVLVALIVGR